MSEESPTTRLSARPSTSTIRPRLQLYQRQGNANQVLITANIAVSERRPEEALALYTHILHQMSPGHISALLNRSLCYITTGHYELAAMDAYRAAVASHDMRDGSVYFQHSRYLAERAYLCAEEVHVNSREPWTRPSGRYVADGWASSPLASIVINDQPDASKFHSLSSEQLLRMSLYKFLITQRDDLCAALEVRATYRLCGALFLCGGGARYDALGLLDDGMTNLDILDWERSYFSDLGNEIMADITHETDEGDRLIVVKGIGHEAGYEMSPTSRAERLNAIKTSTESRSITINHMGYPDWNKSEPDLSKEKWRKILQDWIQASGRACTPRMVVQPEDPADDDCWMPYVQLVAEKDFEPGELIMSESSIYNVTTIHSGQQPLPRPPSFHEHFHFHFCNVCAALLIIPNHDKTNSALAKSPGKLGFSSSPRRLPYHLADDTKYSADQSSDHHNVSGRPSSISSNESFFHDFRLCNEKHKAPLCSETCSAMHNTFNHPGVCRTNLERNILLENLQEGLDLPWLTQVQRETRALHYLLLFRAMAHAMQKDKSLLHLPEVAFATAGINLNTSGASSRSEAPCHSWSFTSNIVKPVSILHRMCRVARADPFVHLSKTEGWILNIVLAKIRTAASITPPLSAAWILERSRHSSKLFDDEDVLSACYLPKDPLPDEIRVPQDIEAVRVGRLSPVLDMIRFAELDKGETPNVRFEHNSGVQVYATVKIAKGHLLLRTVM